MDRKEQIIQAAKELLSKFGFKKTTMEDIARAARMAKATLYYYFTSKEDILREIIQREGESLRKELEEGVRNANTAKEKLKKYAYTRFHFLRKLALYYKTINEKLYSHIQFIEQERKKFDEFEMDMLEKILREGVERGEFDIPEPRLYAFMLLQAIKGLEFPLATGVALNFDGKEMELDRALSLLLNILLHGISKSRSQ